MEGDITLEKLSSNINLREEIRKFMNTTEYQVLLQRVSQKVNCSCWKPAFTEGGDSRCSKCLGRGRLFRFTKHKSYKQDTSRFAEHIGFPPFGEMSDSPKTFFFEHDVHPKRNDYIWEVTFAPRTGKPVQLLNLYKITEVADMRSIHGRIEYYAVWAVLENIDKDFKNMYIGKAWRDLE
jgi:hypothetical protein